MSSIATAHASGTTDPTVITGDVTAFGVTYTNWEEDNLYICECDFGRTGADCSNSKTACCWGPTCHVQGETRVCGT